MDYIEFVFWKAVFFVLLAFVFGLLRGFVSGFRKQGEREADRARFDR